MRRGRTFRLARTHPAHARLSGWGHYCAADPWRTTPSICTNLSSRKPHHGRGRSQRSARQGHTRRCGHGRHAPKIENMLPVGQKQPSQQRRPVRACPLHLQASELWHRSEMTRGANSGLVRTTANSVLIDAERLGGLEIDDRPEFGGLLDRNIARFRTFKILSTK
jgi:hypothetical protein